MQELDQQQARAILKDRGTRFLDYLAAVSRTFAGKTPQRLEDSSMYVLSSQMPALSHLITVGPAASSHAWFTIKQPDKPKPVHIPVDLEPYISRASARKTTQAPKLNAQYEELKQQCRSASNRMNPDVLRVQAQVARIEEAFRTWKAQVWVPWTEKTKPLEQAFDLYQKLFDLYLRLDKESDYFELLFGHCILTWSGRRMADYPLVLTGAHMIFKESTGTILIEANAPSRMSVAPFEGTDLPGYDLLARYQDAFNDDPIDVWNVRDAQALAEHIVKQLGASASIGDGLNLKPGDEPVLQQGWCLLLRKRTDNTSAFYRGLANKLQNTDYLPEAFDAMFSDISVVRAATGGPVDDGTAERLLMPLPANDDQKRIVEQLAHNSGVTVQGPPGTGKSHTIVNLVSHLLAHGKRVLVTAEKAQALAVLQDKIPQEIRDFAVASIGDSVADTESLRLSVQRMQDSLTDVDPRTTRDTIERLNQTIDQTDARIEEINHELVRRLEHQMDEFDTIDGRKNAAQVAQWIADQGAFSSNVIPDSIQPTTPPPLDDDEYVEYISLADRLSSDDMDHSALTLPNADDLPSAAELEALQQRLDMIRETVNELERSGLDVHVIDGVPTQHVESSLNELKSLFAQMSGLDGDWERELGRLLRSNGQQRAWLRQSMTVLRQRLDQGVELSSRLLGHVVSVPEGNPKDQRDMLSQWQERVRQGRGLPRVFHKELREFGESVSVDGYMPKTVEDLNLVGDYIEQRQLRTSLVPLVEQAFNGLPAPHIDAMHDSFSSIADSIRRIADVNAWWEDQYPHVAQCLRPYFPMKDPASDLEDFAHAIKVLEGSVARREEHDLRERIETVESSLERHTKMSDSPLWSRLLEALRSHDYEAWQQALAEATRLARVRHDADRLRALHDRLAAVAPQWADSIMRFPDDSQITGEPESYRRYWNLAQSVAWLDEIAATSDVAELLAESRAVAKQRHDATLRSVGLSARLHLKETQNPDDRTALNIWLDAMKRYGKGTGKNAENYLATARHELPRAMNAMPVWIMPLHKVMDNFNPAVSQLFDVIIVDESSQCDLLSVGVLALARKAVIVGDDKQTSPSNAFKSIDKMVTLQDRYIPDIPGKSLLTFDESLYSMSNRVFQSQIMLREHFRCVPEIIDYSNRFYDRQIFPLRECSHPQIGSPLQARYVPNTELRQVSGDPVNDIEAQAIADQIRACCADPRYDGMTFGVVTLMRSEPHQQVISDKIREAIGTEEYAKRRMRVGYPPAFQGDERNVIFLSFVTNAAGGRSYTATSTRDAQWANVAASRAQDQLWAFYSMNPSDLNVNDLRRGLIEYVRDYAADEPETNPLMMARTGFERDVIGDLDRHGYLEDVRSQYRVGRYTIDCVVDLGGGLRLAIECDGDEDKRPEEFAQDIAKQRVLERLGWNFIRLSAPSYYLDPEHAMKPVYEQLELLASMRQESEPASSTEPEDIRDNVDGKEDDETQRQLQHVHDATQAVAEKADSVLRAPARTVDGAFQALVAVQTAQSDTERVPAAPPFDDKDRNHTHIDSGTDASPSDVPGNRSVPSASKEDIEPYSVIEYAQLLSEHDMPVQGVRESDDKWLKATLFMLVANEFPLSDELMRRQVVPILRNKGLSAAYADRCISGAVEFMETRQWIQRLADGYCYPKPIDTPFRIIQGRTVSDISVMEVSFVVRQLSLFPEGKRRSALESQLDRIYGWRPEDLSSCALVDQAFRLLTDSGLAIIEHERVEPTRRSLDMGLQSVDVWMTLDECLHASLSDAPAIVSTDTADNSDGGDDIVAPVKSSSGRSTEPLPADVTPDTSRSNAYENTKNDDHALGAHRRVFTTFGERYHLRYAEPVPARNLPLRTDYDTIDEWLVEIITKLVYSEYPVCYAMLNKQLSPIMDGLGIPESVVDGLLQDAIKQCSDSIRKKDDGFYYPIDERHFPFRIIRHREIGFISIREIAFVMRQIIRANPGKDRNWLFDETFAVYGFRHFSAKVSRAFDSAYRYLVRNHFIDDRDGTITTLSESAIL